MPCFKSMSGKCSGPELTDAVWGGGVDVCQFHLNAYATEFESSSKLKDSYREDYARIKILLERKNAVIRCMRELANEMAQEQKSEAVAPDRTRYTEKGFIKFSVFLSKYEHICWFPPSHHVFLGFVRPDDFLELIRQGILAKDPGAGPNHGDFTHRLQWHVISRVITDNFRVPKRAGWDHTPIELLSSFGSDWAKAANAWAVGLEKGDGFDHPDNFNSELRKGDYGFLKDQVVARFNKRSEQQKSVAAELPRGDAESAKDFYFRTTGIGVDRNVAGKQHYRAETTLVTGAPVAQNTKHVPAIKDTMPIGGRILMSRSELRKDDGVFCENLGVLARRWNHPYEYL